MSRKSLVLLLLLLSGLLLSTVLSGAAAPQATFGIYMPLVMKDYQLGPAIIEGVVFDATIGQTSGPLAGAQVCIKNDPASCVTTDETGYYQLTGIQNRTYTIVATLSGYSTLERTVSAKLFDGTAQSVTTVDLALSPAGLGSNQYRIVLTWGGPGIPTVDLDANLWLPRATPYHIQQITGNNSGRGNCSAFPWACIDIDSVDGAAPETITISQAQGGTYVYAVRHYDFAAGNYNNKPPLDQSGAHVDVYDNNGLVASFDVPPSNDDFAIWWHVFDMDGSTGAITPVNVVNSADPTGGGYPADFVTP